jgi:hypothetical protein
MRLADLSNETLGAMCRSRYSRLAKAHADGLTDTHPSETWNEQSATLRSAKAQDEENTGLGPRNLQRRPDGKQIKSGEDDVQAKITGGLASKHSAQDSAIARSGRADIPGQLNVAAALRVNPSRVEGMMGAIKGYGRLSRR